MIIEAFAVVSLSPFGLALAAIRENADRAAFTGINVKAYHWPPS